MKVIIKVTLDSDIRRLSFEDRPSFAALQQLLRNLFVQIPASSQFVIKYLDDENDMITLTNDREMIEAWSFISERKPPVLRLTLSLEQSTPAKTESDSDQVHPAVCDSCNNRIVGIRYKCLSCPDYDLCQTCEPKSESVHDSAHSFAKIKTVSSEGFGFRHRFHHRGRPGFRCHRREQFAVPTTFPEGKIYLKSHHGKFLCAENDSVNANRDVPLEWEEWTVVKLENGKVALKSCWGKFLTVGDDFSVKADREELKDSEQFECIQNLENGKWSLKTRLGTYLCAEQADHSVIGDRAEAREWEQWRVLTQEDVARFRQFFTRRAAGDQSWRFKGRRRWGSGGCPFLANNGNESQVQQGESPVPEVKAEAVVPVVESVKEEPKVDVVEEKKVEVVVPVVEEKKAEAAPVVEEDEPKIVKDLLDQLESMGFSNRVMNKSYLIKNRGDIIATVHDLITNAQ